MSQDRLIPVNRCLVKQVSPRGDERLGLVMGHDRGDSGDVFLTVNWIRGATGKQRVPLSDVQSGFRAGTEVRDTGNGEAQGEGVVMRTRYLGGRDQVLVDFASSGRLLWMPFEILRPIKGAEHRFLSQNMPDTGEGERFRLKTLAHALEVWNENTGSLAHLDIDPLPHQIHLVHHILASGNLNWLIADDVGLGKTIETGMLLAALRQRGRLNRVLLVTPAGLTRQWRDELNNKFRMGEFMIYGEDFMIDEPRHWKMFDHVIASIDRLKLDNHMDSLNSSGYWDLVIFDEAHKLSRRQYGMKFENSDRYRLAQMLRKRTDSILLLSATPHQGMQDKFQALLKLIRPERDKEIDMMALKPEIIGDMVFRNNKSDVIDVNGDYVFHGKTSKAIRVPVSEQAVLFDRSLQTYLRKGYSVSRSLGVRGKAIGFVMTVYRKLAASSVAAIERALRRRYQVLSRQFDGFELGESVDPEVDGRFFGEHEETVTGRDREFFSGEMKLLEELIEKAVDLRAEDQKLLLFMDEVVEALFADSPDQKLLIFTEYRATQDYILQRLEARFGTGSAVLINGSMTHVERRESIAKFEDSAWFLISTEAGGEGINLQRKCHVMVNYDLPWNPMRLVQRIGRLYRYGQTKHVLVFNIHSPDTLDEKVISTMYDRIDQVVDDLAGVSDEFNPALRDDILGQIVDLVEVEEILAGTSVSDIAQTQERIDEALLRAREASRKQQELFDHASGFDPDETRWELKISVEHAISFVKGMFELLGVEMGASKHDGRVIPIRLNEQVRKSLGVQRSQYEVTFDRDLASTRKGLHVLDLDSFLMRFLLDKAKSYSFRGQTAVVAGGGMPSAFLVTSFLRWQNSRGERMRQEFLVSSVLDDGRIETNPEYFSEWLKHSAEGVDGVTHEESRKHVPSMVKESLHARLSTMANADLHPENRELVSVVEVGDLSAPVSVS